MKFGKKVLSRFILNDCERLLFLSLTSADDDKKGKHEIRDIDKNIDRYALILKNNGSIQEKIKYLKLNEIFGEDILKKNERWNEEKKEFEYKKILLKDAMEEMKTKKIIIEAEFDVTTKFIECFDLEDIQLNWNRTFEFSPLRPDILYFVPPTKDRRRVISHEGIVSLTKAEDDERIGIRVIDAKSAEEATAAHFAELVLYAMALDSWLIEKNLNEEFVVLADAAIWTGAEDRLQDIRSPEDWERSLVTLPAEVVVPRIRRFFKEDIHKMVETQDWRKLDWHMGASCIGCEYFGYRPDGEKGTAFSGCWKEMVENDHLMMIPGLDRASVKALREEGISTTGELSSHRMSDAIFEKTKRLRGDRHLIARRAFGIENGGKAEVAEDAGTSPTMAGWSDISVVVTIDFESSTNKSFVFAYKIYGMIPKIEGEKKKYVRTANEPCIVLVDDKNKEQELFIAFLKRMEEEIRSMSESVKKAHVDCGNMKSPTLQIIFWDRGSYDQICRLIAKSHETGNEEDRVSLSWMFPNENDESNDEIYGATSPTTILMEAVSSLVVSPITVHHDLHRLEKAFRGEPLTDRMPDSLFYSPLTDRIPSDRGNGVWNLELTESKIPDFRRKLENVVKYRLSAVKFVSDRILSGLGKSTTAWAPRVDDILQRKQRNKNEMSDDLRVLLEHSILERAWNKSEISKLLAMPIHKREALSRSVVMTNLLKGEVREAILGGSGLSEDRNCIVFKTSRWSSGAKIEEGEDTWSMIPESVQSSAHHKIKWIIDQNEALATELKSALSSFDFEISRMTLRDVCRVEVVSFDRKSNFIILRPSGRYVKLFNLLRKHNIVDYDVKGVSCVVLDPIYEDRFTDRFEKMVKSIGRPNVSNVRSLLGGESVEKRNAGVSGGSTIADLIWNADRLASSASARSYVDVSKIMDEFSGSSMKMTERQTSAVVNAATKRLSVVWGPPGTGKSTMSLALLRIVFEEARRRRVPMRVCVTGPTWVAIDNIFSKLAKILKEKRPDIALHRLSPSKRSKDEEDQRASSADWYTDMSNMAEKEVLKTDVETKSVLVGATAGQLAKLYGDAACELFDFILIDEASQMDMPHAVVALAGLTKDGCLTVVGDDKQMPPIETMPVSKDANPLFGSVYDFFVKYRETESQKSSIVPVMLNENYRSNKEIVGFFRHAGYRDDLKCGEKNENSLMELCEDIPFYPKEFEHDGKLRSSRWKEFLSPKIPLIGIMHNDRISDQKSESEAKFVAAVVRLLYGRLGSKTGPMTMEEFFADGIGVVTPHRAQRAAVIDAMIDLLPKTVDRKHMASAVDTVERFQGQERTVMIASFGVGSIDQIAAEEDFLFDRNRFNVIVSRAKSKLIVLASKSLVEYLPSNVDTMRKSQFLKHFFEMEESKEKKMMVPCFEDQCTVTYKYRS